MHQPAELVGSLIGRYKVMAYVAHGSMGLVYRCQDTVLGRSVALKLIRRDADETGETAEARKRLLVEAQAAGRITHPNIVAIHDFGETPEHQYICMEFIEGRTLESILVPNQPLAPADAAHIAREILQALGAAHAHGVVHRDLKPSNIMLLPDGRIKVMDFGIAKLDDNELTAVGTVLGTPYYMSPEQIAGARLDGRSDLFSLGALLYRALTGVKPFTADTSVGMLYKIMHEPPEPPGSLNPNIPPALEAVVAKALAKKPEDRFPSAAEMLGALDALDTRGASTRRLALADLAGLAGLSDLSGLPGLPGVSGAASQAAASGPTTHSNKATQALDATLAATSVMGVPAPAPDPAPSKPVIAVSEPVRGQGIKFAAAAGLILVVLVAGWLWKGRQAPVEDRTPPDAPAAPATPAPPTPPAPTTPPPAPAPVATPAAPPPPAEPNHPAEQTPAKAQPSAPEKPARPETAEKPPAPAATPLSPAATTAAPTPTVPPRAPDLPKPESPAAPEPAKEALPELLRQANKHLDNMEYTAALRFYRQAVKLDPRSVETLVGMAGALLGSGDASQALKRLDAAKALVEKPSKDMLLLYGQIHVERKDYFRAELSYKEVLTLDPDNQEAKDYLASRQTMSVPDGAGVIRQTLGILPFGASPAKPPASSTAKPQPPDKPRTTPNQP